MKIIALILCFICALWASPKDTLIIAVENEAPKINPAYSEDHDAVIGLIFSGLIRFDENMKAKPYLAKSWSISKDGLVYELELRDDILWHDGAKFSAKDVKFSLEAFKDPKNNAEIYVNFKDIKKIEILSDYK